MVEYLNDSFLEQMGYFLVLLIAFMSTLAFGEKFFGTVKNFYGALKFFYGALKKIYGALKNFFGTLNFFLDR